MERKNLIILIIIAGLIILVILFWDLFVIKNEEIIEADYCEADEDCVLSVNPYSCCIQIVAMNKGVVDIDENFVVFEEGIDYYEYPKEAECLGIECTNPALDKFSGAVCKEKKCIAVNKN